MRTSGGFGVVLHAERGERLMSQPFDSAIVQVDVSCLDIAWQALIIDREAVVLRGDLDLAVALIDDGLIDTTMAELELEGLRSECLAENLMPQADAKDRHLAQERMHGFDGVADGSRIAGAVREEDAVWLELENVVRRRIARHDGNPEAGLRKMAKDVPLHAVIDGDDVPIRFDGGIKILMIVAEPFIPGERPIAWQFADDIPALHFAGGACVLHESCVVDCLGCQYAPHRATGADSSNEITGIDPFKADNVARFQERIKVRSAAIVARHPGQFTNDEPFDLHPFRLLIVVGGAIVADERIGHCDDLAAIRRVGERLLIAHHRGVEDDFAADGAGRAERSALVDSAIFECEFCGVVHNV